MFRKDRNGYGGGIIIYINENILYQIIVLKPVDTEFETIFIEFNLRKRKWLMIGRYNPPNTNNSFLLSSISKALDNLLQTYENVI